MKKLIITGFIFLLPCISAVHAQTNKKLEVSLVALQVINLDSSINWYTKHLGFKIAEQNEYKDYGMRLAILSLGDFELELVETRAALDKGDVLKKANASVITGIAKVTFTVADIQNLYKKLEAERVNIVIKLSKSNRNPALNHFIVTDNEGNWMQFLGR